MAEVGFEQYWNDVKVYCRERCDYTMTGLNKHFPIALAQACPIARIRKFMQRTLDHARALGELTREGDFSLIPSLRKKYKSHRRAELVTLGVASEEPRRDRTSWGKVHHARLEPSEAAASGLAVQPMVEEEAIWSDSEDEYDDRAVSSSSFEADAIVLMAAALADATFETVDVDTPPLIAAGGGDM